MKIVKQLALFGSTLIIIFLISEVFIRNTHLASVLYNDFYEDIGRGRRRNLDYVFFNEGFGIGRFNQYRYIGKSRSPKKHGNTVRCILMGDSHVESFQVFERDYFGVIAEHYLEDKYPEREFEFLNFGRSGFDIADLYAYQKTFADKFNPDFIIYMVFDGDLEPRYSDPLRPKTILENDSLKISFEFDEKSVKEFENTKFLFHHSTILNMIANGRKKIRSTPMLSVFLDKIYLWLMLDNSKRTPSGENSESYKLNPVTERIIKALDSEKVIIINSELQGLPEEFRGLCTASGLMYFDLGGKLLKMKEEGEDPNKWDVTNMSGHWNHKAHKFIGEELGRTISNIIDSGKNSESSY